jgi:hypothetical protein
MLSHIIQEFRKSGGAISLNELSRRLGVERSALDGMLETLVRQGRLNHLCAGVSGDCSGSCQSCGYHRSGANLGMLYELVIPDPPEKQAK